MLSGPSTPRKPQRTDTEVVPNVETDIWGSHPSTPPKFSSLEDVTSRPSLTGASSSMRTYGGKSRSFLVALGPNGQPIGDDTHGGGSADDDLSIRESYDELRQRWGVDNSEDDPYPEPPIASPGEKTKRKGKGKQPDTPTVHLPPGMMNDLKSITELRSKGESRRFLDDVGYLFEGLETSATLSVRRASAIEIVTKLCDADFARKAKAADFLGRTWDAIRESGGGKGDKVLDTVLVLLAALVARDPRDLPELLLKSDFTSTLFQMLSTLNKSNDPLWLLSCGLSDTELKQLGVAKVDKTLLSGLHRMVLRKSDIFETETAISNRLLITYILSALPPRFNLSSHLDPLLSELLAETEHVPSRIICYASGLPLAPSLSPSSRMHTFSFLQVDHCLRLLDSYLLGRWSDPVENVPLKTRELEPELSHLPTRLIALCSAADITSRDEELDAMWQIANKCMDSALRVLISLTHDSAQWSHIIAEEPSALLTLMRIVVTSHRQRMISLAKKESQDESETSAQLLDRLCLALGVLTNLIQNDRTAATLLQELQLGPDCNADRGCCTACQCLVKSTGLDCLASVYLEFCELSGDMDVVVRGHIAILFGLLLEANPSAQKAVLHKLPGATNKKKIGGLVDDAREFTLFYVEFAKKASAAAEGGEEAEDEDTSMGKGADMRMVMHDSQGESVARDVLEFLTKLQAQTR
ncbi:hypothetical protein BXZ70DRAFT_900832 [Cristinia sonorae]|uniref:Wings apart-like protein C-terminal domain-containing protein n=1 Tax=Cristinia sonorae TaxID=1940300 RepID=A0A8K0UET7_9AGAR|nr:hypothetical protein BXZ70DRAFT_900832 [Cristinia sonorae]